MPRGGDAWSGVGNDGGRVNRLRREEILDAESTGSSRYRLTGELQYGLEFDDFQELLDADYAVTINDINNGRISDEERRLFVEYRQGKYKKYEWIKVCGHCGGTQNDRHLYSECDVESKL